MYNKNKEGKQHENNTAMVWMRVVKKVEQSHFKGFLYLVGLEAITCLFTKDNLKLNKTQASLLGTMMSE